MDQRTDGNRRDFLRATAMTMMGAQFSTRASLAAAERPSRQLAAIGAATEWINSPPLPAPSLLGKVVLAQFGTYTCINWLRTLPYIRAWAREYERRLILVGVHTPEFSFEKNLDYVRRAVVEMKLGFPVAVDSDYAIWRAFNNQYWPALYLLDERGRVRYQHFGEGEYERSELAIQDLLARTRVRSVDPRPVEPVASGIEVQADWQNLKSPELYLGHTRHQNFSSRGGVARDQRRRYAPPERLGLNHWGLSGEWTIAAEPVVLGTGSGGILCRFHARDVHLVMGASRQDNAVPFRVLLDGHPPGPARGVDLDEAGCGTAREPRLYQLVRQPGPIVDRTVAVEFASPGVEAFAFTFG